MLVFKLLPVHIVCTGRFHEELVHMRIRPLILVLSAVLVLGCASIGFSQTAGPARTTNPTYELSAGYQFLHLPDQNFPFGVAIDGAWHRGPFGLVAEAGWSRHSDDPFGTEVSANMFHFAAGPRWTGFGSGRLWPYAQVLVGAAIAHSSSEGASIDVSDTDTAFMLQPGVGVTIVGGDGWGVFGQVDYRRTFFDVPDNTEDNTNNQFRVFVGLRMILD
jgi:hypothetical protein